MATYALIGGIGTGSSGSGIDSFSGAAGLNLVSKVDPEVQIAFNDFVSKYSRSFITKEEYRARLANFRDSY